MAELAAANLAPRERGKMWGDAQGLFEILDRHVIKPDYLPDAEKIPPHLANAQKLRSAREAADG